MAEQANYQGEHIGLSLNRDAVFAVSDALERLRFSVSDRGSESVPLRLPDGRTLQLRLSLNDAGTIRDANGDYLDDDRIAHADVSGDLEAHAEARQVLNAAARPSLLLDLTNEQLAGDEPVALDQIAARRVNAAIEDLPYRYGRTDDWVERLRTRAMTHGHRALPEVLEREQVARRRLLADREEPTGGDREPSPRPSDPEPSPQPGTGVDASAPPLRPPARLRNRHDDDRREGLEEAQTRRQLARQASTDGRDGHAAYWETQANWWDTYTAHSRAAAIAEEAVARAEDPDGYADRLTDARDAGRTAGSDGRSAGAGIAM